MFNRRAVLASALVALAPTAPRAAPSESVDDELSRLRKEFGLPAIGAAIVRNGVVVASGVVGVRTLDGATAATSSDRFHIGSDTKAMTATLAGILVDEGKLAWNATLGDVLGDKVPKLNAKLAAVSLEQLLSHTSGIPSDTAEIASLYFTADAYQETLPAQRLHALQKWRGHKPASPPGSAFHYANLGYLIAGAMIEKAAGMAWEELITTRLFAPLALASAGLGPQATRGRIDAPVGHLVDDKGGATPMPWGPAADVPAMLGPAGVVHLSIADFAAWAGWNAGRGQRGACLVKPETLAAIHRPRIKTGKLPTATPGTPQEGEYALGWGVLKFDWTPTPVLQHNGSNGMNLAKILVDCDRDVGVVVCTNFPGPKAEAATAAVMASLYRRYAL